MDIEKVKKVKKIISRVFSASLMILCFSLVAIASIYKLTKNTFYFFNHRFDVVLTSSMATKNEKYIDFLEGHDNQIDKFDFIVSKKVNESTPLDVYDIVLFNNPAIGTDTHRIVDKKYEGDVFFLDYLERDIFFENDVFKSNDLATKIKAEKNVMFNRIDALVYTTDHFDLDEYYFNVDGKQVNLSVEEEYIEKGYYQTRLSYSKDSNRPCKFSITKKSYTFNAYFSYIHLINEETNNDILITPEIITGEKEQTYLFNPIELFMIRGDAAPNEDGWFYRKDIYSKVVNVVPKFGYFSRFISSPYGAIMLLGIGIIPFIFTLLYEKKSKNEK